MKKVLSILIILVFVLSLPITSFADDSFNAEKAAELLNQLGLFSGTAKGYELDRGVSRVEGSVMIVRLLGKEDLVKANKFSHPFKDVPAWADNYIGYLYQNGITSGVDPTRFGSNNKMDAVQYTALIFRALGYDSEDFVWNQSLELAVERLLLTEEEKQNLESKGEFLREDMVLISFDALEETLRWHTLTLADRLIKEGAIYEETYKNVRDSYYMCGDNKYSRSYKNPFFQQKAYEYVSLEEGAFDEYFEVMKKNSNGDFSAYVPHDINWRLQVASDKFYRAYYAYVNLFLEEGDKNLGTYRKTNVKDKLKEEYGVDIFQITTDDLRIDIYNRTIDIQTGTKGSYGGSVLGSVPGIRDKYTFYDEVLKTLKLGKYAFSN